MADETLSFNVVGNDAGASRTFRNVGDSADIAAKGALRMAAALDAQQKAAKASAAASLTLAKADQILAEAEKLAAADSTLAADAILAQGDAAIVAAAKTAAASKSMQDSFKAARDAAVIKAFTPGGGFGGLGGTLSLFAVPALTIGGWHLLADAIAETTAVLLPATVATVAFAAAAAPTVQAIVKQFQNLNTVSGALGTNLYPLTGGFDKLAAAAQPRVYQLLGDALVVLNSRSGELTKLVSGAGQAFDQLAARATAALVSSGASVFLKNAVADLAQIGTVVGNIFGTVGNLLKVMPGYAGALLNILTGVTHGLEAITGSGIGQGILKLGLAFHGAFVYAGLLGTGLAKVIQPALSGIGGLALKAAVGLERMAGGSSRASEGMAKFALGAEKAAGLPWGWIAVVGIGLGVLTYKLLTAKDAAQQWFDAQQKILAQQPAVKGYTLASQDLMAVWGRLGTAQEALAKSGATAAGAQRALAQNMGRGNPAVIAALHSTQDYSAAQHTLAGQISAYQSNLADLSKQFGGTAHAQFLLTQAGLTWGQVATRNKAQLASNILQMQAADSAFKAMALGTGRTAAAMNALNITQGTGNTQMAAYLAEMQKVVTAQDQVTTVVTGSEQSFYGFITALKQTGLRVFSASTAFTSLAKQTRQMSVFWNNLIPAGQKLIDTLNLQDASTGDLTKAVATISGEMGHYTSHNQAAKAAVVALINNALGPGTVSLQTLNKWVKDNSTSLTGLAKIVDANTIKAGTLAGVLKNQLNVQFHQALLQSSGADQAIKTYTGDLVHNQDQTAKGRGDRQRLITDLENAGLSAKQATGYVNGLSKAYRNVPSSIKTDIHVSAQAQIAVSTGIQRQFPRAAKGMLIAAGSTPTADDVLIRASKGELIVPTHMVKAGAVDHLRGRIPGFASGGVAGSYSTSSLPELTRWVGSADRTIAQAIAAAVSKGIHSAIAAATGPVFGATPGGGAPAANAALARRMYPPWASGAEWNAWNAVAMAESGWNQYIRNPSSGAYGIPQALPPSKMGAAANPPQSNPGAQIAWMIQYIRSVYGDPIGAAAHENAYHWYGSGFHGYANGPTLFGAGERGRERVDITPDGQGQRVVLEVRAGNSSAYSKFLVDELQKYIRVAGGGDVQVALGG